MKRTGTHTVFLFHCSCFVWLGNLKCVPYKYNINSLEKHIYEP
jgi:hypothetical protein